MKCGKNIFFNKPPTMSVSGLINEYFVALFFFFFNLEMIGWYSEGTKWAFMFKSRLGIEFCLNYGAVFFIHHFFFFQILLRVFSKGSRSYY